ncbi:MAG: site-2 protease family protein, partial [Phycisphaerales bacterium]
FSLVVFAIAGIGWGARPLNPSRLRGRHAEALVAFAGPMMNISLALVSGAAAAIVLRYAIGADPESAIGDPVFNVWLFCNVGCWLNIVLAVFNLLPAPPLDGSRILADFVPPYRRLVESEHALPLMIGVFAIVYLGGFDWLFGWAGWLGGEWMALVLRALP